MKARDLLVIVATASIVMAAAGAVTWPLSAAIAKGENKAAKFVQPKLELGGVVYTWDVKSNQGSEGTEYTATLVCVNTTDEAVDTTGTIRAQATPVMDPRSRAMLAPKTVCEEEIRITLESGETRRYELPLEQRFNPRQRVTFQLLTGGKSLHGFVMPVLAAADLRNAQAQLRRVSPERMADLERSITR